MPDQIAVENFPMLTEHHSPRQHRRELADGINQLGSFAFAIDIGDARLPADRLLTAEPQILGFNLQVVAAVPSKLRGEGQLLMSLDSGGGTIDDCTFELLINGVVVQTITYTPQGSFGDKDFLGNLISPMAFLAAGQSFSADMRASHSGVGDVTILARTSLLSYTIVPSLDATVTGDLRLNE